MNPFALPGPPFLLFFIALILATAFAVATARKSAEGGEGHVSLTEPYAIAYLRGGPNETLRVASVALVDRGLLTPSGTTLQTAKNASSPVPLEAAILDKFRSFGAASSLFTDRAVLAATEPIKVRLEGLHLLPGPGENATRLRAFALGLLFLLGVAGVRFAQAYARGRRNVGFLVFLTIVSAVVLAIAAFPRRTARGERLVQDLRTLFSGLRSRASSLRAHRGGADVALLAAVFGTALLPAGDFGYVRTLYPRATSSGTTSSSCGSSCGSSSSDGGSCGGGCGGGCGGCGG